MTRAGRRGDSGWGYDLAISPAGQMQESTAVKVHHVALPNLTWHALQHEGPSWKSAPDFIGHAASRYSIISSARANTVAGASSLSAFAVFTFRIVSMRTDCWTSKSAGLSPRRMRPTSLAARR
jgi:hypothetical protein